MSAEQTTPQGALRLFHKMEKEIPNLVAYARSFRSGNPRRDRQLELKLAHSLRVPHNARFIAGGEKCFLDAPEAEHILCMAALYHDIGRFEQLRRFNTFRDTDSVNHALLGVKILSEWTFLIYEPPALRQMVRRAVLLHNRPVLPPALPEPLAMIAKALRDADKIDIISVLQEELRSGHSPDETVVLELQDRPEQYSPEILEAVLASRPALYADMKVLNDLRLLLCNWVFSLEFAASRRLLALNGHMEDILDGLPRDKGMDQVRERVRARLGV